MGADARGRVTPRERELDVLVPAAARGDAEAWALLTERFTTLLWAVARSYRLDDADAADVVQNTWLRLLDNLTKIERPMALPGWLKTTATREALTVIRRRREVLTDMTHDSHHQIADEQPDLDTWLLQDERDAHLWTAFRKLPERDQRLLLMLVASETPPYAHAAAVLDVPIGSIGPTRMRALAKLRRILLDSPYPFDDVRRSGPKPSSSTGDPHGVTVTG